MASRNVSRKKTRSSLLIDDCRKSHSSKLCLCGLDLNRVPDEIYSHPFSICLEVLDLSNNNLVNLSENIGLLANLTALILSGNALVKLPNDIGSLRKLVTLDVSRNCLECLPKTINNLKELNAVNLSGNDFKTIPEFLLRLPRLLKVFCIRNPNLENIPKWVAADGLVAMRNYLKIQVEEYESNVEKVKLKERQHCGFLLSEIEQKWVLEDEQFVKKTKDVSTQLDDCDDDDFEGGLSYSRNQGALVAEVSTSTQTDLTDGSRSMIFSGREVSFTGRYPGSEDPADGKNSMKCHENQALENLVKIFHKQIKLVSDCRTNSPGSKAARRTSCNDSVYNDCFSKVSRSTKPCHSCGLQRRETVTSEYGSMSSCSYAFEDGIFADKSDGSCDGNSGSHDHDDLSDNDLNDLLEDTDYLSPDDYDDDIWSIAQQRYINACKELVIRQNGVEVKVPEINLSGHRQEEFSFQVISSFEISPALEDNMLLATPVVQIAPHGAKFYLSMEAIVKLPLNIVIGDDVTVQCYESDTDEHEKPSWQEVRSDKFEIVCGRVIIKTNHFSLFCATASKAYPHVEKRVSVTEGATLAVEEAEGCKVHFPKGSLKSETNVSLTVLFSDSRYKPNSIEQAMASPIVALEPSGVNFEKDVTVTLPLPDAKEVYHGIKDPELIILESQTHVNEKPLWKELKVPYKVKSDNSTFTVAFNVTHFTIFTAIWNFATSTLEAVKKRAEAFVPQFTHRVYFQALMSDSHHNRQFGLCVLCHLAGNPPVTDCSQFPIEVGRSKPRDLSKGEVVIELKSKKFTADEEVCETGNGLIKTEAFNGLEFDKQFALKFIDAFKEGIFGTVIVSRKENANGVKPVADFLIQKASCRKTQPKRKPTALETKLSQEVAGLLAIEDRWKELGLALGYTRNEINTKFSGENPIDAILTDFMARGGDDVDFITAMYEVARRLKLIPFDQMMENRENRRMENRIQPATGPVFCNCTASPEKTPLKNVKRKLIDRDFEDEDYLSDARLDRIAGQIAEKWKHVGRALEIDQKTIAEIDLNNRYEGGREKAFQMFAVWKEMYPERCSASVLKRALSQCGLNNTAKRLLIH